MVKVLTESTYTTPGTTANKAPSKVMVGGIKINYLLYG